MAKARKNKNKSSTLIKDFDKQKTKLGRGKKPAANNATNTSFKARSIALTQQSITKDRSTVPTSKRNLTADELIGQTRHYSASVRRDALNGLKEIYQSHNHLSVQHLGLVVPNVSRLISDEDATVRSTLHSFLTFYLGSIPSSALQPYTSTLLLFTTSAMSHIYPDIRLDAVRILDLLYPALGPIVTSGWQDALSLDSKSTSVAKSDGPESNQGHGDRILRCYLSLLGISLNFDSSTSTNASQVISSDLSPGARLLILRSMHHFFQNTTDSMRKGSSVDLQCPTWFWDPCFASLAEMAAFRSALNKVSNETPPSNLFDTDETCLVMSDLQSKLGGSWNSAQVSSVLDSIVHYSSTSDLQEAAQANTGSSKRRLFKLISPLLISVFLDAAPTAFALNEQPHTIGSPSTSARLVFEIAGLTLALWRGTTQSDVKSRESLGRLLSHMAVYFPFGNEWDEKARIDMINLNLIYC